MDRFVDASANLAEKIPQYADRFQEMTRDTESMATQLEERMRFLEDGYDHLDQVATNIPEYFREMATAHKNTILDAAGIMAVDEKENMAQQSQQLDLLKRELQSISHERVIVDVFTRSTISRAKRHSKNAIEGEPSFISEDRKSKQKFAGQRGLAGTHSFQKSQNYEGVNTNLLKTNMPERAQTMQLGGMGGMGGISGGVSVRGGLERMSRSELSAPISLPHYGESWGGNSGMGRGMGLDSGMLQDQQMQIDEEGEDGSLAVSSSSRRSTHSHSSHNSSHSRTASRSRQQQVVTVRSTRNTSMVPSMRRGTLPPELRSLDTHPSAVVTTEQIVQRKAKKTQGQVGLCLCLCLSLRGYFSILLASYFMGSGALDSSDVLLSYTITSLA